MKCYITHAVVQPKWSVSSNSERTDLDTRMGYVSSLVSLAFRSVLPSLSLSSVLESPPPSLQR